MPNYSSRVELPVIKIGTRWGHAQYQVLGSTATYSVFPGEGITPAYCTCPAFAYSVMLSKSEIMCKHLLATKVALRLSRQLERPASKGFLAQIAKERYSQVRSSQA
ncbi:hypothetical protein K474DRAFT_1601077 [Panus rudis PR-1116 ss-1]|nr:hypothetical protein K474DRAFT_1601077 [Panus rudis PR-1116 ss-1]